LIVIRRTARVANAAPMFKGINTKAGIKQIGG